MSNTATVLLSVVLAAGASVAAVHLMPPAPEPATEPSGPAPVLGAELERRIAGLETALSAIDQRLQALAAERVRTPAAPLEASHEKRPILGPLGSKPEAKPEAPGGAPMSSDELAATVAKLRSDETEWEDALAVWTKLPKAQRAQLLKEFEQYAKQNPQNPDAQNDLGEAYVQCLINGTMLEMMTYGPKAMDSFNRALELDNRHWRARFNRAMSYAHQPDILGNRGRAVSDLELLMKQQEEMPPERDHSATYVFLGNLYEQQGKSDDAKRVWERGLARHPSSKDLKERLK